MVRAFLVLPNQLMKKLPPKTFDQVILIENHRFFEDFRFHKKKLVFHRASLKYYQHLLEKGKRRVSYLDFQTLKRGGLGNWLRKNNIGHVSVYDPIDHELESRLKKDFKKAEASFEFLSSPLFICQESYIKEYFSDKKHYSMNSFYISQRKKLNVLIEDGKPAGGKWSFDKENRRKLSKDVRVPQIHIPRSNKFVKEAQSYISKNFPDNPGSTQGFIYPVTHKDSAEWFKDFLENRLDNFGPYEDTICAEQSYLFHSLLSPLLNCGLLTAEEVLAGVMDYSHENKIRLSSLEGFVRQIIGWREFMRAVYMLEGEKQSDSNFWRFKRKLPDAFYDGTTDVEPVDVVINRTINNAYAHHIERLMVLGNFMLLCEISPREVYRWFMEMFIDAYDWVMVPNVFGMSQYSDGGMITTKPYISSSNYIRKMSDFKTGSWCEIWDSLFWRFIYKHKAVFDKNPRVKMMASMVDKMNKDKINRYVKRAESYLKELYSG